MTAEAEREEITKELQRCVLPLQEGWSGTGSADLAQAFHWTLEAAEQASSAGVSTCDGSVLQGHAEAQCNLAAFYQYGWGVEQVDTNSAHRCCLSADITQSQI